MVLSEPMTGFPALSMKRVTSGRLNVLSNLNRIILASRLTANATAFTPGRCACALKPKAPPPNKTGVAAPAGTQTPAFSSYSQSEADEMDRLLVTFRQLVAAAMVSDIG